MTHLKPIIKWTGGKRREIKHFEGYFPNFIKNNQQYNYAEPFIGGGAVYWYLNNSNGKNTINDFDNQLINFYQQFAAQNTQFIQTLQKISTITRHKELEQVYYSYRNLDQNNKLLSLNVIEQAVRFFVINQLAFSGMRRFNSSGEFNVPFGHYKGLNTKIVNSIPHQNLLKNTNILNQDFETVIQNNDQANTFIFLDPPYTRQFKTYSANNCFQNQDQKRLAKTFKNLKHASAMLIINKSDLIEQLYSSYIKNSYLLKYGVNIKNRFNTNVEHLIICNY